MRALRGRPKRDSVTHPDDFHARPSKAHWRRAQTAPREAASLGYHFRSSQPEIRPTRDAPSESAHRTTSCDAAPSHIGSRDSIATRAARFADFVVELGWSPTTPVQGDTVQVGPDIQRRHEMIVSTGLVMKSAYTQRCILAIASSPSPQATVDKVAARRSQPNPLHRFATAHLRCRDAIE